MGKYWGCSNIVGIFFLRNPSPKPTGVLENCREGKTVCFPFFGTFVSDCIPKAKKGVSLPFFINNFTSCSNSCKLHLRILVNYTNEFRELYEAAPYVSYDSCLE